MLAFTYSTSDSDLAAIIALQQANLARNISSEDMKSQGFVTVEHDLPLLSQMNSPYPHAIVKDADKVVGYALVMLPSMAETVPVLIPMFDIINTTKYKGKLLSESTYFVMGQVCIDKDYRGKGLFQQLYTLLQQQMKHGFTYMITEVSKRNTRSLRAHYKVGFQSIKEYKTDTEEWVVLLWEIGNSL